jgi:transposase-like protein
VKRQFDTEIIVLCVRWYISYRLSYRALRNPATQLEDYHA